MNHRMDSARVSRSHRRAGHGSAGRRLALEPLESRQLMSVSLDANGWTVATPSADTRTVYVSSSTGADSNTGLSPNSPVKTLAKAKSLLRQNSADHLLLKSGDTFHDSFGKWQLSGRSAQEPILISSYGVGARPIIDSGISAGIYTEGGANVPTSIGNVDIIGIQFDADTYNGSNGSIYTVGVRLTRQGSNWLIEDCKIQGYKDDIVVEGDGTGFNNFQLRRSEILDSFSDGTIGGFRSQGLYTGAVHGLLVEGNVFDHNGWNPNISNGWKTVFNHDIYVSFSTDDVTVRDNIITRASLNGAMIRPGGDIEDNLFVQDAIGITTAGGDSTIANNVILQGLDLSKLPQGLGINVNPAPSAVITGNIIAHNASLNPVNANGIGLTGANTTGGATFTATVENNIVYDWQNALRQDAANTTGGIKVTVANNQFQEPSATMAASQLPAGTAGISYSNNDYWSTAAKPFSRQGVGETFSQWKAASSDSGSVFSQEPYVDPNRDLGEYNGTLDGAATFDAFIAAARNQSKATWNNAYTAIAADQYIRAGFALKTTAPVSSSATSPKLTSADIGAPLGHGSIVATATGYDVTGGGTNMLGTSDQGQFAYTLLSGDFDVSVRVDSIESANALAKAGLMVRTSLSAGSQDAFLMFNKMGARFDVRQANNAATSSRTLTALSVSKAYLRLTRTGTTLTGYIGTDGTHWTAIGSVSMALPSQLYVGLAVTNLDATGSAAVGTASFTGVKITA
jgi:hypothetical protein